MTNLPTKKLKFHDDVLAVLKQMDVCQENGHFIGRITEQLDRDLYLRVNKALEALGGKWTRKVKGHVFSSDPRLEINDTVETGEITVVRDGFFETPAPLVHRMVELAPLDAVYLILEPSAGEGAIIDVLLTCGALEREIDMCELDEKRLATLRKKYPQGRIVGTDFMQYSPPKNKSGQPLYGYDRIYMNPPFELGQDIDHVMHAYSLLEPKGILIAIMSEGSFYRPDKKATHFREWLDRVGGEAEKIEDGHFSVRTRMVRIRKI